MDPKKQFQNFLIEQNLKNQKVLLMVSGGVDSMVLLDIATKIIDKKNIAIFHLNHNARTEAQEDQTFVQNICSIFGVKFYSETLPVNTKKQNIESDWRKLRKKYSEKFSEKFMSKAILTAHHATDLVETMLFRLTKGCGVSGLSPFDKTTKPFWNIPKSEIIKYAQKNKLEWREDCSNNDIGFERNLIRLEILPPLRKITPNLEKVFVKESEIFEDIQAFLEETMTPFFKKDRPSKITSNNKIDLKQFQTQPKALKREFLRKISQKTPSFNEIEDGLKWLKGNPQGNSKKEIGGTKMSIEKGYIVW